MNISTISISTFISTFFIDFILQLLLVSSLFVFLLYMLKIYKKKNAGILLFVVFGLQIFSLLSVIILCAVNVSYNYAFGDFFFLICNIICLTIAMICLLKGFKNNKQLYVLVISIVLGFRIFYSFLFFRTYYQYVFEGYYGFLMCIYRYFDITCSLSGDIPFFVALLLLGLGNKLPSIILLKNVHNPTQTLEILKEKMELGMITEEEYQKERAEIINKL